MKHQLQTIRAALAVLEAIGENDMYAEEWQKTKQALNALSELERMAREPVAILWQVRRALARACAICDAVPSREPGHLGKLVNAQPDGTHGYREIHDAEAALVAYLTTPEAAPPTQQPQYEAGDVASAAAQGFRDGVASVTQQEPVAEVESLRLAGLTLIGLAEHDQHCEVFDLDDEGKHRACNCGLADAIETITQAGKTAAPVAQQPAPGSTAEYEQWVSEGRPIAQQPQAEAVPAGWLNAPVGYAPTFLHQPQPPAPLTKQEALIAGWTPLFKEAPQQAEAVPSDDLHTFLDAAAGEGLVLDGVGAADLYIKMFPERYAAAIAQQKGGV